MNKETNTFNEELEYSNKHELLNNMKQNFFFLNNVKISNIGVLELYQHQTGVILAFMKTFTSSGPTFINCKLSFTTVPKNNKGIPHALEHLIFNGSAKFPFNDSIDKISSKLCCPYTNAFTLDDLTTFEFECTTEWSLLRMLEVWLDHLFHPFLSEESFLTEVVHLDENAEYHGVVYSEVSSFEKNYDEIVNSLTKFHLLCDNPTEKKKFKLQSTWELYDKILDKYDGGKSNVFSCTGRTTGIEHLTLKELKEFHAEFYNLNNMLIFIHGNDQININNIFEVVGKLVNQIDPIPDNKDCKKIKISGFPINKGPLFKRKHCFHDVSSEQSLPWHLEVPFPSEEEDLGTISFSWRFGVFSNFKEMLSVTVLLHYLCVGNDSPLIKELVEDKSYCSDVDILNVCEKNRYHQVLLKGVEKGKFNKAVELFKSIIIEFQNEKRNLVLNDLKCKIEGLYYGHLVSLENKAIDTVFQQLSSFINYGIDNMDQLASYCNLHVILEELLSESLEYWKQTFNEVFCLKKMNILEFVPSQKLSKEITMKFKNDKRERIKSMGEDLLQNCKAKLQEAVETNKKRTTTLEKLRDFDVPFELNNINLNKVSITTNLNYSEKRLNEINEGADIIFKKLKVDNDPELQAMDNCLYFFLENSNTEFVHAQLRINLDESLSNNEKLLTSFLVELLFQTSVKIIVTDSQISEKYSKLRKSKDFLPDISWIDGEIINYDDFDRLLNTFCIDYYAEFSDGWILDSNTIPNQIKINWTAPKEYAEISSVLIISGICGVKFSTERISTIAKTIKGTIAELKLSEESLITSVSNSLCFCDQSIFNISNIPNFDYLSKILIKDPKKYLAELERIYSILIKPFNFVNSDDALTNNNKFSLFIIGSKEVNKMNILKYFCFNKSNNNRKQIINNRLLKTKESNLLPWEILSKELPLELGIDFDPNNSYKFRVPGKYGYSIYLQVPSSSTACFVQSINLNTFGSFSPKGTHFYNPDIPALLVLTNYLWEPCSLLFESIRGSGLAYSGSLDICLSTGQFSNCVYESTSIGQSLIKTWEIFREISMDEIEVAEEVKKTNKLPKFYDRFYNGFILDEAKRIAAYKFISKHKKFNSWAKQLNFDLNVGISPNFDKYIVKEISKVSVEDIKRVSKKYLKQFLPNTAPSSCIAFSGGENSATNLMKVLDENQNFRFSVISYSDFSRISLKNIQI